METYNPLRHQNAEEWLALDEYERIRLVKEYHENYDDVADDALEVHAVIHVIVENQLALEVEFVPATIAKLTRQGLDRHEAIHAVGAIITDNIFDLLKGNIEEISPKRHRRKLERLTAKRWRKGQW